MGESKAQREAREAKDAEIARKNARAVEEARDRYESNAPTSVRDSRKK